MPFFSEEWRCILTYLVQNRGNQVMLFSNDFKFLLIHIIFFLNIKYQNSFILRKITMLKWIIWYKELRFIQSADINTFSLQWNFNIPLFCNSKFIAWGLFYPCYNDVSICGEHIESRVNRDELHIDSTIGFEGFNFQSLFIIF